MTGELELGLCVERTTIELVPVGMGLSKQGMTMSIP